MEFLQINLLFYSILIWQSEFRELTATCMLMFEFSAHIIYSRTEGTNGMVSVPSKAVCREIGPAI